MRRKTSSAARRQDHAQSRADDERYRTLTDHLTELVYRADPVTLAGTFVNPAVQAIYGYSVEEWLANPGLWAERIHPDDRARILAACADAQRRAADGALEYRVIRKDGGVRWVVDRFGWEKNARGDVIALVGVMSDITDWKRAEEAQRDSERKLTTIIEAMPGFLYRCANTRDWPMEFISQGVFELTGYRAEEFLSGTVIAGRILHPEDSERVWHDIQKGLRRGGRYELEYRFVHRDGTVKWAWERGMGVYDSRHALLALEGVVLDVTERRRAEAALRDSEARLASILETVPNGIMFTDPSGTITFANPAAEWLVGLGPGGMAGRRYNDPAWRFVTPDGRPLPDEERLFNRVLRTGQPIYDAEMNVQLPNGRVAILSISAAPLTGPDGAFTGVVGAFIEITDRKRAEAELRDTSAALRALSERVDTSREEEAARIARELHDDLGQMLTGLKIDLSWLDAHLAEEADQRRAAALREKSTSMMELIDTAVEAVRRIAADLRPALIDDLGLAAAIEWRAQQFQARTGIPCAVSLPAAAPPLAPPLATALYRILQEALTNVIRHAAATHVDIALSLGGASVVLEVRDDGRGITAEAIASRQSIGLLGMRERARALSGTLTVAPRTPHGTRVRVEIPL